MTELTPKLTELNKLLANFDKQIFEEPNFFQIAGFPHYENVASNVLKFFLDPSNKHSLGSILIESIFETCVKASVLNADELFLENPTKLGVSREINTGNGRLDILIESDTWIMAIENKVRAQLVNDLNDYSNYLASISKGRKTFKLVLSITRENPDHTSGFKNITYKDLIETIESKLQNISIENSDESLILFKHFIKNMKNQFSVTLSDDAIHFLTENSEKIDALYCLNSKFDNYLKSKLEDIKSIIEINHPSLNKIETYVEDIWYCLIYETHLGQYDFKTECILSKNGEITFSICCKKIGDKTYSAQENLEHLKKLDIAKNYDLMQTTSEKIALKERLKITDSSKNIADQFAAYCEQVQIMNLSQ